MGVRGSLRLQGRMWGYEKRCVSQTLTCLVSRSVCSVHCGLLEQRSSGTWHVSCVRETTAADHVQHAHERGCSRHRSFQAKVFTAKKSVMPTPPPIYLELLASIARHSVSDLCTCFSCALRVA